MNEKNIQKKFTSVRLAFDLGSTDVEAHWRSSLAPPRQTQKPPSNSRRRDALNHCPAVMNGNKGGVQPGDCIQMYRQYGVVTAVSREFL